MSESATKESCFKCGIDADRIFKNIKISLSGTKVTHAEYNPAFGKVIRNERERRYEAEKRGLVEVGNDFKSGEAMRESFDKDRAVKREKSWEAV